MRLHSGTDRISFTTNDVITAHGTTVRRSRQYVWATNGVDSMMLVGTREASVDGLRTWSHAFGLTNSTETLFPAAGVRQVISTRPDGSYSLSQFTNGLLVAVTEYDSGANQIRATTFGYDAHGRQSTVTDARNGTTTYARNDADQVLSVTTPVPAAGQSAQTTVNHYDEMGRVWKTTLADNTAVTNEFYLTGDLKKTYGSRTYPVQYVYDAQGRMTNMTTWKDYPSGGAANTRWLFNERGFMTNKIYADNLGPSYSYTAAGRLSSRLWARGIETEYGYNNAGQVETVDYTDSTPGMTNSYDRLGRLVGVGNGTNSTTVLYNEAGQLLSETCNGFTVTSSYDALLRRTVLVVDGYTNTVTHYGYDSVSRLAGVTNGNYSATYSYHVNSPLVSGITFRDGATTRMTTTKNYDFLNRLTEISSAPSAGSPITFAYGYNLANQRTSVTNGETRTVYGYDSLGQVTSARKNWTSDGTPVAGQQFEYGFDNIGNRKYAASGGGQYGENLRHSYYEANELNQNEARTVPGYLNVIGSATNAANVSVNSEATTRKSDYYRAELAVDNSGAAVFLGITNLAVLNQGTNADFVTNITGNLFLPQTPEVFLHDADGNLTNDGRWIYTWDAENRLIGMLANSGIPAEAKKKLDFGYDYRSRRTRKEVFNWNGASYVTNYSLKFVYDGWNLLAELNETNAVVRSYTWGSDLSGSMQGAGGVGGLLAISFSSNDTDFVTLDGNGNVTALVGGPTGAQTASYDYGVFGDIVRCDETSSLSNPFRFSTKYFDVESQHSYYGHRYLRENGCWLSRDPVNERGGVNLYGFVGNNPITGIDFLGLALYAFDGTGNNNREVSQGKFTWVLALFQDYDGEKHYENGVGSSFGARAIGGLTGLGGRARLESAYLAFLRNYNNGDKSIDIIGFSRGAAMAREFANMIYTRGDGSGKRSVAVRMGRQSITRTVWDTPCEIPEIRFVGLFDTVASFGAPGNHVNVGYNLGLPPNVRVARQAVAADEQRYPFPVTPLSHPAEGQDFAEVYFPGDHSDIGRGHGLDTRDLSFDPYHYIWSEGRSTGVPFGPLRDFSFSGNTTPHDLSSGFPYNMFPKRPR